MVDTFTEERFKNKRLFKETGDTYYDDLQASQKVGINSAYGLCGVSGLNFNDFSIANEITRTGRQRAWVICAAAAPAAVTLSGRAQNWS